MLNTGEPKDLIARVVQRQVEIGVGPSTTAVTLQSAQSRRESNYGPPVRTSLGTVGGHLAVKLTEVN